MADQATAPVTTEVPISLTIGHEPPRILGTITEPGDLPGLLRAVADLIEHT